jgi:hypothetical protein
VPTHLCGGNFAQLFVEQLLTGLLQIREQLYWGKRLSLDIRGYQIGWIDFRRVSRVGQMKGGKNDSQ